MYGRGAKTSTSFFLILSSPPPIPASLIGEKVRWRKPSMSLLHSLLFLLCACFTPPPCVLCRPSELCVHFDPSVTTSQAFWPFLFFFYIYMEPVLHLLPNHEAVVWPFIRPPPSQVMEFYNSEQRAKLGEGSGILLGVRKSWPRDHSRVHWCEDFLDHL